MAVKRPLSTKGKIITGLIYALAIAMVAVVIFLNRPTTTEQKVDPASAQTTTASVNTDDLPYNTEGSDKYADLEPAYKTSEVELRTEGSQMVAYVKGEKAGDYTGVCSDGKGWYFVRDGVVDTYYNGIAGNELGNWYVKAGKVDFTYSGNYTVNGSTYAVEKGNAKTNS